MMGIFRVFAKLETGPGLTLRPRPAARSGCEYTAQTECLEFTNDSKVGTEKSGVPAKTIFNWMVYNTDVESFDVSPLLRCAFTSFFLIRWRLSDDK